MEEPNPHTDRTAFRWEKRLEKLPLYPENVDRCARLYQRILSELDIPPDAGRFIIAPLDAFHDAIERIAHDKDAATAATDEDFIELVKQAYQTRISYALSREHKRRQTGGTDFLVSPEEEEK
jgi:hypothetical protein